MTADSGQAADVLRDEAFLADLRRQMVRFATLQLGDEATAEDAVQEALIAALRNAGSFAGRAALRTWVFAILRNKIVDQIRQRVRTVNESALAAPAGDDDEGPLPSLFDARGHWLKEERPAAWDEPDAALQDARFWQVFEACLDGLPPRQARVFMMREFVGLEATEICTALSIAAGNLHVLLHRARLRLRECLENRWFLEGECPC